MKTELSGRITKSVKDIEVTKKWWIVDANGKTLGRLATQIASLLRGKNKTYFTPHIDCGDYVIVLNAEKVIVEGKRFELKEYFHYTGYPGGEIFQRFKDLVKTKPEFVIRKAVWGMLPKNRLGRKIIKKLKVYRGESHPHIAQKPEIMTLKY
ncbi:MAG: 50S ribosomal protein L13 [Ignavibacteria bacterium]|nr:50S ribosomal protein L13 [Ignavibacteria bacterium]